MAKLVADNPDWGKPAEKFLIAARNLVCEKPDGRPTIADPTIRRDLLRACEAELLKVKKPKQASVEGVRVIVNSVLTMGVMMASLCKKFEMDKETIHKHLVGTTRSQGLSMSEDAARDARYRVLQRSLELVSAELSER